MKITKTKSGKWTTVIALNGTDGKRHLKRFTDKSKDKVRNMANDYLNDHRVYMESLAFEDAMERYIDRAERSLSPSTIAGYKSNQRTLKKDYAAFCRLSCDRIRDTDIQTIIDDMKAKKRTPKTIRNRLGLISAVLNAEQCRMPLVKVPPKKRPRYHIPDVETMRKVAAACTGRYSRMAVPVALAIFGLRRGEICAVTAEDVSGCILHVTHAVAVDDDGFSIIKAPKTEQSVRDVQIPEQIADAIRQQGRAWTASPNSLTQAWRYLLIHAGVDHFRLHDCRHFFVSYCHDVLHLSDEQIMRLGGWETDHVMKERYRHAITDQAEYVSQRLATIL